MIIALMVFLVVAGAVTEVFSSSRGCPRPANAGSSSSGFRKCRDRRKPRSIGSRSTTTDRCRRLKS